MNNRIQEVAEEQGVTQRDIAAASGLSEEYVSKVANGHITPRIPTARKIAKALGVGIDDIFPPEEVAA